MATKKKEVDIETERQLNDIDAIADAYADGFMTKLFSDGILNDVSVEKIQEYLTDPDKYHFDLTKLAQYYYISSGEVFQLFDLPRILPTLNYRINVVEKTKNYEKNIVNCNKALKKVKHKQLTRDIVSQLVSSGTVTGIWLGDKKSPYLFVFERADKVFPSYRLNGEWIISVDLSWLEEMKENERTAFIESLSPYLTKAQYDKYISDRSEKNKYIDLPQTRTVCLRTHALKRNQAFGVNWSTPGLFDLKHKKKLKDLEKAVANKIISAVAVLTIGSDIVPENGSLKLSKGIKKKIHTAVKTALEKNTTQGISVISIPEYAKLEFPQAGKTEALDPKKFDATTDDVNTAFGTSPSVTRGTDGNFASGKLNLDVQYKKLAVVLEDIETEVYGKLFTLILPQAVADDFEMIYDKEQPLTLKEKTDYLMKLHTQEGFSLKAVIDNLNGIDFQEYVNQSIYEQEELKLSERIKPYASAFTSNGDGTKPTIDNPTNENTNKTKTTGGNDNPSAS